MAFIVNSLTQINNYTLRALFSENVRALGDGNFNDGLNLVNYLIKGPNTNSGNLSQINTVPGNGAALDLVFQHIMVSGNFLVQFSPNIATFDSSQSLAVINNLTIGVNLNNPPTLTGSLQAQTAASQLLDNFNPALRGVNWEALFESIGNTQDIIDTNAKLMSNQIFISQAGSTYLDQRLSEINIVRPTNFGLNDSLFRRLGLILRNKKLVRNSIEQIINVYYGDNETLAFQQSNAPQPYGLSNNNQLFITIDSSQSVIVTFTSSQFKNIANASATEVSAVINNTFEINGINAYCTDFFNLADSQTYLRIFSNNLSLTGNIQIFGGQAQNSFLFPSELPVTIKGSSYQITPQANGVVKIQWVSGNKPNFSVINVGDYFNFYTTTMNTNRGTFTVTGTYSDNINNIYYILYVNPLAFTESVSSPDLEFYRPIKSVLPKGFAV